MTLRQLVETLESHDDSHMIYLAVPWRVDSLALVMAEPASGKLPEEAKSLGMNYFLEVGAARDFLKDWLTSLDKKPTRDEKCQRLLFYAINDA